MKDSISSKRKDRNALPRRTVYSGGAVLFAALAVVTAASALTAVSGNSAVRIFLVLATVAGTAVLTALLLKIRSGFSGAENGETAASLRDELQKALKKAARAEHALAGARSENDEFIAMLSHELRTPSNSLLGWTRLLNSSDLGDGMRERALDGIETSVGKQLSVVNQLTTLRDLNESAGLPLDDEVGFSGLIEDVIEEVRPAAEKASVYLDVVEDIGDLRIRCDRFSFRDALERLVRAAVSFAPRGSTIRLFARLRGPSLSVTVKNKPQLAESGPQPDSVPLHRTTGTLTSGRYALPGLSLAISKKIAEMHGGSLSLSAPRADDAAELDLRIPSTLFVR